MYLIKGKRTNQAFRFVVGSIKLCMDLADSSDMLYIDILLHQNRDSRIFIQMSAK